MARGEARQQYEFYSAQYARFGSDIAVEIRREVYGEDQGQQGWRTLDEQAQIAALIDRKPCHVLDIGCGSGGPSLALVATTGCTLTTGCSTPRSAATAQISGRDLVDPDHDPTERSGPVFPPDIIEHSLHDTGDVLVPVDISLGVNRSPFCSTVIMRRLPMAVLLSP